MSWTEKRLTALLSDLASMSMSAGLRDRYARARWHLLWRLWREGRI